MSSPTPTASVEPLESRRLMAAQPIGGIGVLGDSFADEYQFYAPDRSTARNFVEQLAASRGLNFGAFDANTRGEPRNEGFEYNWAKDGATTSDLLTEGQHTGLAEEAAAGVVNYAWIFAGGNDLIATADADDPAAALASAAQTILDNGVAALTALQQAKPDIKVVIATVPHLSAVPAARELVATGQAPQALLDAADAVADAVNAQLKALAKTEKKQVAIADVARLIDQVYAKKTYKVGKVAIDRLTASDAPTSLFLADGLHAGTIGQGLLANVFVKAMKTLKAKVKPLSTREILANAGLDPRGQPIMGTASLTRSFFQTK